jgi:hypothetical protein
MDSQTYPKKSTKERRIMIIVLYFAIGLIPYTLSYLFLENKCEIDDEMFCIDVTPGRILSYLFFWLMWPAVMALALVAFIHFVIYEYALFRKRLFNTCDIVNLFRKKGKHE